MKSVFVSSTFKDMQAERDMLQMRVFPRVRKELIKFGEDITFLDLRWGVDTLNMSEDESGHLVLKVCIDAIDRCVPYVIVFLGERYGWIPDAHLIETIHDQRIEDIYESDMSVTNLEIKYGAFERSEYLDHVIFCLRDSSFLKEVEKEYVSVYQPESSLHQLKMNELKKRIQSEANTNVIHYTCSWDKKSHQICDLEDLEEQIVQLLLSCMEKELDLSVSHHPMEELKREMRMIQKQHLLHYVPRWYDEYKLLGLIDSSLGRGRFKIHYHIQAKAGVGKTAFLSRVAQICEEEHVHSILYYFKTGTGQSFEGFKQYLVYRLEEILNQEHQPAADLDERLKTLDGLIEEKYQVVCFIDGVDQAFSNQHEMVFYLNDCCRKVLFVLSSLDDFKIHCNQMETIIIHELVEKQVQSIVSSTAKKHGKKVDEKTTLRICSKSSCSNPLYLSNLLQRLFMMSGKEFLEAQKMAEGIEGISLYMTKLIDKLPNELEEIVKTLIHEAIEQFEHPQFKDIVALIAVSEKGLDENELREIFELNGHEFDVLRFSQLVSYLYDVFAQNDSGKWRFTHRLYYNAVLKADCSFYLDLLCSYALKNRSYLLREGYNYLLATQHDQAYLAFDGAIDRYELINALKRTLHQGNGKEFVESIIQYADADLSYDVLCRIENTDDLLNQLVQSGKCSVIVHMKHLEKQFKKHRKDINELKRILIQMRELDQGQNDELHLSVLVHEGRFYEYQKLNPQAKQWYRKAFDECLNMKMDEEKKIKKLHQISEDMMYVENGSDYSMEPYRMIEEKLNHMEFDVDSELCLVKINNLKFLSKGHQVYKYYNPGKMVEYMQSASKLATERAKKTHKSEDYRLVVFLSRSFAEILKPEMQYWAINLGDDYAQKLYEMTGTVDDQWLFADMAYWKAESYDASYRMTVFDHEAGNKKDHFGVLTKNHLSVATRYYETAYKNAMQCAEAESKHKQWYKKKAMEIQLNWCALLVESGQYLKPKEALTQMVEHPYFNEFSHNLQCKALTALLKALLVNRRFQSDDVFHERKSDEEILDEAMQLSDCFHVLLTSDANEKMTNTKRKWMAWDSYYQSLLMFELYKDQEADACAKEALIQADAIENIHERNSFVAMMNYIQVLLRLHQGSTATDLIEKVTSHCQNYPWRNIKGLHDPHSVMYEELPALIQLVQNEVVEKAGEKLRKTHQYFSLRLKKWIETLVFKQCIKTKHLDEYLCHRIRNRFNQYPDYDGLFVQVLNEAVQQTELDAEDEGLSLYAHAALSCTKVELGRHACLLARTMWKNLNPEAAISTYDISKKQQVLSLLDQFAYDSSICLLQWLKSEDINHPLQLPVFDGTAQERLLAEAIYEFVNLQRSEDKLESLMRLNEILPEVSGMEINLIYLGTMDLIHQYRLFEQCTKEQLLQLKGRLVHRMNSRRELAEAAPDLTWYAYENIKIEKMKKLDYRKCIMKINLQLAQCLNECKEDSEAVPYYFKAYSHFTRYEAKDFSREAFEKKGLYMMLEGLFYNDEDAEDLKSIFTGLISVLPSKDPKLPLNFSSMPAVALKLAQRENQIRYVEMGAMILRCANLGMLEEYDALLTYFAFVIEHGYDVRQQFLDMLEQTTVPLTRKEEFVRQIEWNDTQKKRLYQIYEKCALRNLRDTRRRIHYHTEKN